MLTATGDPDGSGIYRYAIEGGTDAGKFELRGTNLDQLYLRPGQSLDFEAGNAQVNIRVTDITTGITLVGGVSGINIQPNDVNEAPGTPGAGAARASQSPNLALRRHRQHRVEIAKCPIDPIGCAVDFVGDKAG